MAWGFSTFKSVLDENDIISGEVESDDEDEEDDDDDEEAAAQARNSSQPM